MMRAVLIGKKHTIILILMSNIVCLNKAFEVNYDNASSLSSLIHISCADTSRRGRYTVAWTHVARGCSLYWRDGNKSMGVNFSEK